MEDLDFYMVNSSHNNQQDDHQISNLDLSNLNDLLKNLNFKYDNSDSMSNKINKKQQFELLDKIQKNNGYKNFQEDNQIIVDHITQNNNSKVFYENQIKKEIINRSNNPSANKNIYIQEQQFEEHINGQPISNQIENNNYLNNNNNYLNNNNNYLSNNNNYYCYDQNENNIDDLQNPQIENINKDEGIQNAQQGIEKYMSMKRWQYLYEMDKKKREAREVLKQILDEERQIDHNCTFQPQFQQINDQYKKKIEDMQINYYQRNKIWQQKKEEKIQQKKDEKALQGLEECTFQPSKNFNSNSFSLNETLGSHKSTFDFKGVDNFIKRQQLARKFKQEKEQKLNQNIIKANIQCQKGKNNIPKQYKFDLSNKQKSQSPTYQTIQQHEYQTNEFQPYQEEIILTKVDDNQSFNYAKNLLHQQLHNIELIYD